MEYEFSMPLKFVNEKARIFVIINDRISDSINKECPATQKLGIYTHIIYQMGFANIYRSSVFTTEMQYTGMYSLLIIQI